MEQAVARHTASPFRKLLSLLIASLFTGAPTLGWAKTPLPTLAVFRFASADSPDPKPWLGRGLSDQLIESYFKSGRFTVVNREEMEHFLKEHDLARKGVLDQVQAAESGRLLKVDFVVFGTYRTSGQGLVVTAGLVDVDTGRLQSSAKVDGHLKGFLDLARSLGRRLLSGWGHPLSDQEWARVRLKPTDSYTAAEHYYQGLTHYDEGRYPEAFREFRLGRHQDTHFPNTAYWVARMYQEMNLHDHARIDYETCLDSFGDSGLRVDALYALAKIHDKFLNDPQEALRRYVRIVESHPTYPHALLAAQRAATILDEDGQFARAYGLVVWLGRTGERERTNYPGLISWREAESARTTVAKGKDVELYVKAATIENRRPDPKPEKVVFLDEKSNSYAESGIITKSAGELEWLVGYRQTDKIFIAPAHMEFDTVRLNSGVYCNRDESSWDQRNGHKKGIRLTMPKMGYEIIANTFPEGPHYLGGIEGNELAPTSRQEELRLPPGLRAFRLIVHEYLCELLEWNLSASFRQVREADKPSGRGVDGTPQKAPSWWKVSGARGPVFNPTLSLSPRGEIIAFVNDVHAGSIQDRRLGEDADLWTTVIPTPPGPASFHRFPFSSDTDDLSPCLSRKPDRSLLLTWIGNQPGRSQHAIAFSESPDGVEWQPPIRYVPPGQVISEDEAGKPEVSRRDGDTSFHPTSVCAVDDEDGTRWLIFVANGHELFATQRDRRRRWNQPVLIFGAPDMEIRRPSLLIDRAGQAIVVVPVRTKYERGLAILSSTDGQQWNSDFIKLVPEALSFYERDPQMLQLASGTYLLVFLYQNNGIYASVSSDLRNWSLPERIDPWEHEVFIGPHEYVNPGAPVVTQREDGSFLLGWAGFEKTEGSAEWGGWQWERDFSWALVDSGVIDRFSGSLKNASMVRPAQTHPDATSTAHHPEGGETAEESPRVVDFGIVEFPGSPLPDSSSPDRSIAFNYAVVEPPERLRTFGRISATTPKSDFSRSGLIRYLHMPLPAFRATASRALNKFNDPEVVQILRNLSTSDPDPSVKQAAASTVAQLVTPRTSDPPARGLHPPERHHPPPYPSTKDHLEEIWPLAFLPPLIGLWIWERRRKRGKAQ